MSYDCYMRAPRCPLCDKPSEDDEDIGNMTSNVSGMWRLAIKAATCGEYTDGLADLHGKSGKFCAPILEVALAHMREPEHAAMYAEMNPANGWGSHEGATRYLAKCLSACRNFPERVFEVSR